MDWHTPIRVGNELFQFSDEVIRIMERDERERQAKEDELWARRQRERERPAAPISKVDLEKHLARRLLHEVGRDALHVTINQRK
jgi:hypothetical protein